MTALYPEQHQLKGPHSLKLAEDRVNHLRKVFWGARVVYIAPGGHVTLSLPEAQSSGSCWHCEPRPRGIGAYGNPGPATELDPAEATVAADTGGSPQRGLC